MRSCSQRNANKQTPGGVPKNHTLRNPNPSPSPNPNPAARWFGLVWWHRALCALRVPLLCSTIFLCCALLTLTLSCVLWRFGAWFLRRFASFRRSQAFTWRGFQQGRTWYHRGVQTARDRKQ